jgi:phytoene dehydrogenase-like protein
LQNNLLVPSNEEESHPKMGLSLPLVHLIMFVTFAIGLLFRNVADAFITRKLYIQSHITSHEVVGNNIRNKWRDTSSATISSCVKGKIPHSRLSLGESTIAEQTTQITEDLDEVVDVIVIGAGIGGLSCAALCASCYGFQTLCLEAHDTPGGVAHSFTRYSSAGKFVFDSGPSLLSGMSSTSTNPLRQVLDAVGTSDQVKWKTYDGWIMHDISDNQSFKVTTGSNSEFESAIQQKSGSAEAKEEFIAFRDQILQSGTGLADVSAFIPPLALRNGSVLSTMRALSSYILKIMFGIGPTKGQLLTGPFSNVMDQYNVRTKFIRYWFDYLAFALSGLDASQTQAAAVAYMMKDLHKPGAVLDYPIGGMDSLIQALVQGFSGVDKSELRLNSRVDKLLLTTNDQGKATCSGVIMANGKKIHARRGVVCNAPLWNMARIVKDSIAPLEDVGGEGCDAADPVIIQAVQTIEKQANEMCMTRSFMHLHLGIPKDGLPDDLECHHSVLNMQRDVTAEQNMVIISIPTVFDPTLAPEGYHVVHAYSAACDNFEDWESFLESGEETGKVGTSPNTMKAATYGRSEEYQKLKVDRAELLWNAIEKVIPDIRQRAQATGSIVMIGTPLTHRRYNQRYKGTYGPAPSPDSATNVWELPGSITPIHNLLACGDTTFPGTY